MKHLPEGSVKRQKVQWVVHALLIGLALVVPNSYLVKLYYRELTLSMDHLIVGFIMSVFIMIHIVAWGFAKAEK